MRNIDTNTINELKKSGNYPVELVSFTLSNTNNAENLYLNTGYKTITFDGNDYLPGSNVVGFSAVEETKDVKTNAITIELNGVPNTIIAALEGVRAVGGVVTIYQAFWSEKTGAVTNMSDGNPAIYQKWKGVIASFSTTEENQQSGDIKINVECKNILGSILNTKSGRYTSDSSFTNFNSGDKSMEFVAAMATFNPRFGQEE